MDRAAQAAGMSKGACMYHFKNKRALTPRSSGTTPLISTAR